MSSRPSRNNQSRYRLRKNPTPKKYPDFLIHEITTARNSLRKTNKVNELAKKNNISFQNTRCVKDEQFTKTSQLHAISI